MGFYGRSSKYLVIKNKLKKFNPFEIKYEDKKTNIFIFFVAAGTNMGDHAIVESEINFINNVFNNKVNIHEITVSQGESAIDFLKDRIHKNDIIILSGGGYIGDEYVEIYYPLKRILKIFKKNKILFMPQTIFFKNKRRERKFIKLCKNCLNLHIFTREERSHEIFNKYNLKNIIVPDIVLSNEVKKHSSDVDILLCMRNDVERKINNDELSYIREKINGKSVKQIDTVVENIFELSKRKDELNKLLNLFSNSSLVITDRIHGMIFSYLTETPCIAMSNYNHKVKSEYEWLKECNYIFFVEDIYNDFSEKLTFISKIKEKESVNLKDNFIPLSEGLINLYEETI